MTITPAPRPSGLAGGARRVVSGSGRSGPPVPYVTPMPGEKRVPLDWFVLRRSGVGVGYRYEWPEDRDEYGVLWWRSVPMGTGGRVPFSKINPYRQRDTMLGLRCQVCTGEPSRTSRGTLFFHQPPADAGAGWSPDGERTLHPPVCLPCAGAALRYCPFVPSAVAVRVKKPRLWGVLGTAFIPVGDGEVQAMPQNAECRYGDVKHRRWVVAQQAIVELDRVTVIDIHAELAAAGLELPETGAR